MMMHEQCNVSIPIDNNIQYIVKYILTEYPYTLIPFASCEGNVDEVITTEFPSAYIGLIVTDLDMLDKLFSEIFGNVPNVIINYSLYNGVRQYVIRWAGCNSSYFNDISKNKFK